MTAETAIRIIDAEQDPYVADGSSYYSSQFGGSVPGVGDLILDPFASAGQDRLRPEKREMLLVKERYFLPDSTEGQLARIVLIVEKREARPLEINLLW